MTVKSLILIMLGGVLVNNYVFESYLGVGPFLGFSGKAGKALRMGLAVTVTMFFTAAIAWPVQAYLLDGLGLGYLQTLVYAAIILAVVYLAELIVKRTKLGTMGTLFPLTVLNSAVLGLAVNNAAEGYNFLEALLSALGAGLGFTLATLVFSGVLARIDTVHVPKAFRGLPVSLLAASIISMALLAFK